MTITGTAAHDVHDTSALRKAALAGDKAAALRLASLLDAEATRVLDDDHDLSDPSWYSEVFELAADKKIEARRWRYAVALRDLSIARHLLGLTLVAFIKFEEAEKVFRLGAEAGLPPSMVELADLLDERDENAEAEHWRRRAEAESNEV